MIKVLGYFVKLLMLQILVLTLMFGVIVVIYIIKCVIEEMHDER